MFDFSVLSDTLFCFDIFGLGSAIGGLFSGVGSIISSNKQAKSAEKQTQMSIDAQREANNANIAAQKDINQQNVASQEHINALMRHDANNAIGIKKQDLINAGYSTANPDLSGNAVATLTAPNQVAPHVESEYPSELAALNTSASQSFADTLMRSADLFSNLAVRKAESREKNAKSTETEKQNAWLDANLKLQYETGQASLDNLLKDGKIKDQDFKNLSKQYELLNQNISLVGEQITSAKLINSSYSQKISAEISNLLAHLDEVKQSITESESRVTLNAAQTDAAHASAEASRAAAKLSLSAAQKNLVESALIKANTEYQNIVNSFAQKGINFGSGNNLVDTIGRYLTSDTAVPIITDVCDYLTGSFNWLDGFLSHPVNKFTPAGMVWNGVKRFSSKGRDRKHIKKDKK